MSYSEDQINHCIRTSAAIARRLVGGKDLRDELESEGMVVIAQAMQDYDPDRGVPFHTYVGNMLRWRMVDFLRRLRLERSLGAAIDTVVPDDSEAVVDLLDVVERIDDGRWLSLVKARAAGVTLKELGARRGVTEARVCQEMTALRLRAKAAMA